MNYLEHFTDQEITLLKQFTNDFKIKTEKDYTREISKFKKYIKKDLLLVHPSDCVSYLDHCRLKKSSGSIQTYYFQLCSFYNFLFDKGHIESNPFALIEKPRASKQIQRHRTPSPEDVMKILRTLKTHSDIFESRDYLVVLLIISTGLKISEVLPIRTSNFIEDDNGHVGCKIGSNENVRTIRILQSVWLEIERYIRYSLAIEDEHRESFMQGDHFLFVQTKRLLSYSAALKQGRKPDTIPPITPNWIDKVLKRVCQMYDLPAYAAKDLRHAHAIFAIKMGASSQDVADQLVWSHTNFIYRYNGTIEQIAHPANVYTEPFINAIIDQD